MPHDHLSEAAIAAHDRQRQLPEAAQRALIDGLRAQLRGRGTCLDAGVGSGSVALPLWSAGIPIVGVDHSCGMLAALRAKTGGVAPFPLVRADLIRLPFHDSAFGAAIAANVFHLIRAWQVAVDELMRVVRPKGVLLVNLGGGNPATGSAGRVQARFRALLGDSWPADRESVGPWDVAEFETYLTGHVMAPLAPLSIRYRQTFTLEDVIARLEHNIFARPDDIDPIALQRAAEATREWTTHQFGSLDESRTAERVITFRIYRLPSPAPRHIHVRNGDRGRWSSRS